MENRSKLRRGLPWIVGAILILNACGLFGVFMVPFVRSLWSGGAFLSLSPRDDDFHEAVRRGDVAEVKRFLDAGKDPDAKGIDPYDKGGGALQLALIVRRYDVAELLVSRGADVNRKHNGKPLLYDFAQRNDMETYEWLVRHGAKPDSVTEALLRLPPDRRYDR